jgi:DNA polymerase-1
MIEFSPNTFMVTSLDELPSLAGAKDVYIDFETTSKAFDKKSVNPHHNCWIAGTGITVDDDPNSYYIPTGHNDKFHNLPEGLVFDWLNEILEKAERWINSNTKYDAHVARNAAGITLEPHVQLIDTVVLARLLDSDRYQYGLELLCMEWLNLDISKYSNSLKPYKKDSLDYGSIPADILGEYCCHDVLSVRLLFKYIMDKMPKDCMRVAENEMRLTRTLFNMECHGMRVDPLELKTEELKTKIQLYTLGQKISTEVGRHIEANNNTDCFDVLCNTYGLPVIEWTDTGNPSFGKHALKQYTTFHDAPVKLLNDMLAYRKLFILNNLFLEPYQVLHRDNYLHADYKQSKRTGRMGCSTPNMQQLSKLAKKLIHPDDDHYFLSMDYSQIEFRLIIHYIDDATCIAAYKADPFTDFHTWVADMCGVERGPAKTLNFMLAFGGGKKRTIGLLANDDTLIGHIKEEVKDFPEASRDKAFKIRAEKLGESAYNQYHDTLPGIKRVSKDAGKAARDRGHVFNLYGRRRHLPQDRAHIAFNTLNQGTAADILKERTVELERQLPKDIKIVASVHDETLLLVPNSYNKEQLSAECLWVLENPEINLRVPLRCSAGTSEIDWYTAAEDETFSRVTRISNPTYLKGADND